MDRFLQLFVMALVVNIILLIITLPTFYFLRNGKEIELPITMLVLILAVLGIISAQIAFIKKNKIIQAKAFSITLLIQILLMILIQIYIFIDIPRDYYWYPIASIILIVIMSGIIITQIIVKTKK